MLVSRVFKSETTFFDLWLPSFNQNFKPIITKYNYPLSKIIINQQLGIKNRTRFDVQIVLGLT